MFLPAPENLDLDRLQKVVDKIHHGGYFVRGEGQTVARIYLMFGEVESSYPGAQYLYVGENSLCAKWAARDFLTLAYRVFPEMENNIADGKVEWYPDTIILPNRQVYRFITVDALVSDFHRVRGVRFDKVFFDVCGDKQDLCDTGGRLTEALIILEHNGAELV